MGINKAFTFFMLKLVIARSFAFTGRLSTQRRIGGILSRNLSNENGVDELEEYRNNNNIRDQVFSAMSADGSIKVTACTARNIVNDLMIMHTMTATPADALSRSVVCALLMSNGMQEEQLVQLTFKSKFLLICFLCI
jgi:hypothetical protein